DVALANGAVEEAGGTATANSKSGVSRSANRDRRHIFAGFTPTQAEGFFINFLAFVNLLRPNAARSESINAPVATTMQISVPTAVNTAVPVRVVATVVDEAGNTGADNVEVRAQPQEPVRMPKVFAKSSRAGRPAEAPLPPAVVEELNLNTESRATYKGKTLTEPGIVDKIKARLPKALLRRNQAARQKVARPWSIRST